MYVQDTQHLLEVIAQLLFFLTPIIYYPHMLLNKDLGWLLDANPVYLFMQLIRTPLVEGQVPSSEVYTAGVIFTTAVVGLAAGMTAWLQKRVIFHL